MQADHCFEVATFKLKDGVDDGQLLELEKRIRSGAIATQPGFISRELAKDPASGEWMVVLRFATKPELDAWLARVKTVPEMREMGAMLNFAGGMNRHFTHKL
jgi:hypothetical protein